MAKDWINIKRKAVKGTATSHLHADGGDLGVVDENAGGAVAPLALEAEIGEYINGDAFQERDHVADPHAESLQVQQRVGHELTRPVVGDLAAAVGLHHRDFAGISTCSGLPASPWV